MNGSFFMWVYFAGAITASAIRPFYTGRRREGPVADDRKSALDTALLIPIAAGMAVLPVLYAVTPWLDFANYRLPTWAGWTGVAIFAGMLVLLWRAHADLGPNWSYTLQVREEHTLITRGVYGCIRHPMYAAYFLWAIGQILLLWNWVAGPGMLIASVPLFLTRIPREERMMLDRFGDEYRAYMNRTGRVIPRLWK